MTTFGTIKEGYLTKSGENNASWKKRYFTIQDDLIYYFASKTNQQAKGAIQYSEITNITHAGEEIKKKNCFAIECSRKNRTYYIFATSYTEMEEWMGAIKLIYNLYQTKSKYKSPESVRWSIVEPFRHILVTSTLALLPLVINFISLAKSSSDSKQSLSQLTSTSTVLGEATLQLVSDILNLVDSPFLSESYQRFIKSSHYFTEALSNLKSLASSHSPDNTSLFTSGTSVKSSIDSILRLIGSPPNPKEELIKGLTGLDTSFGKYLNERQNNNNSNLKKVTQECVVLARGVESVSGSFVKSSKEAAEGIKVTTVQAKLMASVGVLPGAAKSLREACEGNVGKEAEANLVDKEDKLKKAMEVVNEVIEWSFSSEAGIRGSQIYRT